MNVIDRLDAEWERLLTCPRMHEALHRWGRETPVLAFTDLAALVAVVERARVHDEAADAVLAALARRAGDDGRAARVLLQLLLPGCKSLVARLQIGDHDERAALVVAAAYDRIRTYRVERRPTRVAANVLLDVRHRLLRSASDVSRRRHVALDALPERLAPTVGPGPEPAREAVALLGWAVRHGHLDRSSARLIALTRLAGVPVADLARAEGTSQQTVRRRRLRAEERLRALVAA